MHFEFNYRVLFIVHAYVHKGKKEYEIWYLQFKIKWILVGESAIDFN